MPLRGYDKHGRRVIINRASYVDVKKHSILDTIKIILMTVEVIMEVAEDPQAAVKGVVVITDNGGADASLVTQVSPAMAKKLVIVFQVR